MTKTVPIILMGAQGAQTFTLTLHKRIVPAAYDTLVDAMYAMGVIKCSVPFDSAYLECEMDTGKMLDVHTLEKTLEHIGYTLTSQQVPA